MRFIVLENVDFTTAILNITGNLWVSIKKLVSEGRHLQKSKMATIQASMKKQKMH